MVFYKVKVVLGYLIGMSSFIKAQPKKDGESWRKLVNFNNKTMRKSKIIES